MSREETERRFRTFAQSEVDDVPMYCRLVEGAADDSTLMELMEEAPRGQRRPNLLLAAVHDLLLAGAGGDLARWYPTVNGGADPPDSDPSPAFRAFVDAHHDEIVDALRHRSTQTNEVNRSCLWWVAARAASADLPDHPIAIIELGASAGLNLTFDRADYDWGAHDPPGARLRCDVRRGAHWVGASLPSIVDRVGIDLDPIALDDARALRWLKACIWPEQPERHERFDAAVARARADPPRLVQGDLIEALPTVAASLPRDSHLFVMNSWVLAYVERDRRAELADVIGTLGATRPVTWVSAEGPGVVDWVAPVDDEFWTVVGMARWRDGVRVDATVARCHAHLAWLDWFG